jgi:hypothetical protein
MTKESDTLIVDVLVRLQQTINSYDVIDINNKELWKKTLHKLDNKLWQMIINAMYEIYEADPFLFKDFQIAAINNVQRALNDQGHLHERLLDTRKYKSVAWRCLMAIREVMDELERVK